MEPRGTGVKCCSIDNLRNGTGLRGTHLASACVFMADDDPSSKSDASKTLFKDDEAKTYSTFLETVKRYRETEDEMKDVADQTVNFIIRQFNAPALTGVINYAQYVEVFNNVTIGLFLIVHLGSYNGAKSYNRINRRELFYSSYNLCVLLLSMAYEGRKYKLEEKKIDATGHKTFVMSPQAR